MDYSAYNPIVWGLFVTFAIFTYATVRGFLARHPGYPGKTPTKED